MEISKDLQRKLWTILWITLSWAIISMVQLAYEISILYEYGLDYRWSTPGNFMDYFMINSLAFVLNGLLAGLFIVFVVLPWIRERSYARGLLFAITAYVVLFFFLTGLQTYFVSRAGWDGHSPFIDTYKDLLEKYFYSFEFARMFPFWLLVLSGTIIALFVRDKYGPGVLKKFLLGKYFHPKTENRIFMFLDLKGSTAIAEKLGEQKYFKFLQQFFKDITPVILETGAEIYQYVGDEIVLTWDVESGIKNQNCIRCFRSIQTLLDESSNSYQSNFGDVPRVKAGIHSGKAVIGEIGVIKRDIAYSGDVLNTTSRIESKCNEYGAEILISKVLLDLLGDMKTHAIPVGQVQLRGKSQALELYKL